MAAIFTPAAEQKNLELTTDVDSAIPPLRQDAQKLRQILWNLLSNAVKFTPEGGTVHVALRARNNAAEMIITDSGEGIPQDFLPSVFEPFRQADGSTTRPHSGLGLGLSIVKHLTEAMGGTVNVTSKAGSGTTFTVWLKKAEPRTTRAVA